MKTTLRTIGRQSAYSIAQLPIAIAAFTMVLTTMALGVGLIVLVVGLPMLAVCAYVARGFAHSERSMLRGMLGLDAPTPAYAADRDGERTGLRRLVAPLTDPQTWLDVAFNLVRLPLGIASFTLATTWWAGALGGLSYPVWGWAIPRGPQHQDLPELLGLGDSFLVAVAFNLVVGLFFALTLRWVILAATWVHAGPALMMLSSRATMQQELASVHEGRAAARQAQAGSLRRLERDIHDGPQQQIVRLSMDLGRARQQLERDPARARAILDDAIARSTSTLDELRALSRGIAPPILVDRGLKAALDEIATRAPVPVHVQYDVDRELPEHIEITIYFVVSEALTNLAKHAQASLGSVLVTIEPRRSGGEEVRVLVTDDGIGGAHLGKGSGLAGLADRVRAVDGELDILSPAGGPTTIEARMPCA